MAKPHTIRFRATDYDVRILDELRRKRVELAELNGKEPPASSRSDAIRAAIRETHDRIVDDIYVVKAIKETLTE